MADKFQIEYRSSVVKDLKLIDNKYRRLILDKIHRLSTAPIGKGSKKIDVRKNRYRIRVGIYRIIYQVNFLEHIITIEVIRHRKDAYRRK